VRHMPNVGSRSEAVKSLRQLNLDDIADLSRIDRMLLDSVLHAR
jgi:hypothetical protein